MLRLKLIGPPGTGKTERLKNIVREKVEQGYSLDEIVYTSFTNAAANEAASRVCDDFGISYRPEWFRTEHSCCFRLLTLDPQRTFSHRWLRQFSHLYPAYHYSWEDTYQYDFSIMESEGRFGTDAMLRTFGDFAEFFYILSRNLLVSPLTIWNRRGKNADLPDGLRADSFLDYCKRRDEFKKKHQLHDFPDMIELVISSGFYPPEMRILICDEAQDMSPLQWKLIESWAQHAEEFYVAGDYLQSVYGFQGAAPEDFLKLRAETEVLAKSYRLTPPVKGYSEKIARMTNLPYPDFEPSERHGIVFRKSYFSVDWLSLPETFVLCRTRYLINQIRDELIEKFIPFVCERGKDNPMNTTAGYAYRAMLKLQDSRLLTTQEIQAIVEHTTKPFIVHGTKTHIKKLMQGDYTKRQMWQLGFTEEFFKHLNEPQEVLRIGVDVEDMMYLARLYAKYGVDVQPKITLTTMHGSKGREAELVLLNPDMTRITWDSFCESPTEETLLQYVAATRARSQLGILNPRESFTFPLPKVE